jgi:hypothetical protein
MRRDKLTADATNIACEWGIFASQQRQQRPQQLQQLQQQDKQPIGVMHFWKCLHVCDRHNVFAEAVRAETIHSRCNKYCL